LHSKLIFKKYFSVIWAPGRACLPVGRLSLQATQSFAVALKLWWLPAFVRAGAKVHWAFAPSLLKRHIACLPDRQAKSSRGFPFYRWRSIPVEFTEQISAFIAVWKISYRIIE